MKKLVFLILLTATYVMAEECDLYKPIRDLTTPIQIIFTDDSTIWRSTFYSIYNYFYSGTSGVTEDGYNCRKEKYEKAFLDTNTYLYREIWEGNVQGSRRIFIMQRHQSTYKIGDVFKDEFMHWQSCGMLTLTYEQADSLITPLANALNEWFDMETHWTDSGYETDNLIVWSVGGGYRYPEQVLTWAKQACVSETNVPLPINRQSVGIVFKNGLVNIPESLRGETYFLFDVNGKLLQKNTAKETIHVPYRSAILKIGNQKPVLLKQWSSKLLTDNY